MTPKETTRLSKFLSLVLRHNPDAAGIALDSGGWITVSWTRHPIPDLGVPTHDEMARTLDTIDTAMRHGCVYLHCWGGRGRTGAVAGCWLARHGTNALASLAALTAHQREWFPRVPETAQQREFVRHWRAGQ